MRAFYVWAAVAWVAMAAGSVASAQVVATSPAEAGPAYAYQGEYTGKLNGGWRPHTVGVQIVALGDRELMAVEFNGGLPGAGWDGRSRTVTHGTFNGEVAVLVGPERELILRRGRVEVADGDGVLRGYLHKTQRTSPTLGARPPAGAKILFDGSLHGLLSGAEITPEGTLREGFYTAEPVEDFFLHLEFRIPFMPAARDQGRGNSGVYIQERYEVQILDSFGLETVFNGCGSLYRTIPPDLNMSFPPLEWQTYDIEFRAARFDEAGNKTENARLTVIQNGVPIHSDIEIPNKTGAGKPEGPEPRPIRFQDHKDPVRFRNMWLIERKPAGATERSVRRPPSSSEQTVTAEPESWQLFRPEGFILPAQGHTAQRAPAQPQGNAS